MVVSCKYGTLAEGQVDRTLGLGHVNFVTSIKHPNRDVKYPVGCMNQGSSFRTLFVSLILKVSKLTELRIRL